jgi:hypothetical protein
MSADELREATARALHKHSFWDDARDWGTPEDEGGMQERSKEEWRRIADRFLAEVCPRFGIEIRLSE